MGLVMWAPMGAIMLATMGGMYRNRTLNIVLYVAFAAIFGLSLLGIRQQSLVGDGQFLRSMIPHHSGAIMMCEEATLRDPEIRQLCSGIIEAQKTGNRPDEANHGSHLTRNTNDYGDTR